MTINSGVWPTTDKRIDFNSIIFRWSQKESQIQVCFQDFDENLARCPEDRSRSPYQPEDHDFGPLRNPWSMHMGAGHERCLNDITTKKTIHTVCTINVIDIQKNRYIDYDLKLKFNNKTPRPKITHTQEEPFPINFRWGR